MARAIPRALRQHFAAQPGILIDIQHVNTQMWHTSANRHIDRLLPALRRLMGKAGDKIDIDIVDAESSQAGDLRSRNCARVQATHGGCFPIDKRLHAKADAIKPKIGQNLKQPIVQLAGRGLQSHLSVRRDHKYISKSFDDFLHLVTGKKAGSSTAEVNTIDFRRQDCRPFLNPAPCGVNLFCQPFDVRVHPFAAENVRSEIAIAALGATERDGNINSKRIGRVRWHTRAHCRAVPGNFVQ